MPKTNLDVLSARLLEARDKLDALTAALKMSVDELQRMDKQIALLRRELKNVGCENCAHQDCGNTEEPCKSCGIRELAWEWEGWRCE